MRIFLPSIFLFFARLHLTIAQVEITDRAFQVPFSVDETHITVWNGEQYVPLFIKGVNMGVAIPGTFPGQLLVSYDQYLQWFYLIREAGFNAIRLYTLHFPQFYEALRDFNEANPRNPLLVFHGVWLEEEVPGYTEDLISLSPFFWNEIEENVDCVHGNRTIAPRNGKAYGEYTVDISKWVIGWIIGREIYPSEVLHTNKEHPDYNNFEGEFFYIYGKQASEVWMTRSLNHLVRYEWQNYGTMRPVSSSSWPTLDPIHHPLEKNRFEDTATIDLGDLIIDYAPAGYFASYHAYPYYPDFIVKNPQYQDEVDYIGQNSYLAYLKDLKSHYKRFPLLIAEFGGSSSWGKAHYAQNGIHHGGATEREQGHQIIRMFRNLIDSECAGGISFAWIDEWFKRTWITDEMDWVSDRRILWHNVVGAEQNFGIIGFREENKPFQPWQTFDDNSNIKYVEAKADYAFFHMKIKLDDYFKFTDSLIIGIDTYDAEIGESILPTSDISETRAEFALIIKQFGAQLFVTQAYDLFGIWHDRSGDIPAPPEQRFRSIPTDGAPWRIVRLRNNSFTNEVQFIGNLSVNTLGLPLESTDAVIIDSSEIYIKIPWNLLNFTDPSERTVMHDDRSTFERETTTSDGISITAIYRGNRVFTPNRFLWEMWQEVTNATQYEKESYRICKQYLRDIESAPIAKVDFYSTKSKDILEVNEENGILKNDWVLDGGPMIPKIVKSPSNGLLQLNEDGSFTYQAVEGFEGEDFFTYRIISGHNQSVPTTVWLTVTEGGTPKPINAMESFVKIYPNPSTGIFRLDATNIIDRVIVYDSFGNVMDDQIVNHITTTFDLTYNKNGVYFVRVFSGPDSVVRKVIKK